MTTTLVTGGTGTLGRPTVERLRAAGHDVRILSRRTGPGRVVGDLTSGTGLAAATDGVDVIVHLATSQGRRDLDQTRNLLGAMPAAAHLIAMSIAGVDEISLPYYRTKLGVEHLVAASGVPYTILRATQFHDLVFTLAKALTTLPLAVYPSMPIQPVDAAEVATRLAELAASLGPGSAPVHEDFGGPEIRDARDLWRTYLRATGRRRLLLPLRVPGRTFGAFRDGGHLTPDHALGTLTWESYLARRLAESP
jgi:uncharacterized protein YbjT (DUF2867 family)